MRLVFQHEASRPMTPDIVKNAKLEITELGEAVLQGEIDYVKLNGIDHWLDGVHLSSEDNLWRWDENTKTILHE